MKAKLIDMRLYKIANTENYDGQFLVKLRANIDNIKPVIYTSELSFVKIQKLLDYGFIYSNEPNQSSLENKRYKIIDIRTNNNKQDYYLIRDDSNKLVYYNIDCFISIQKHRDKQINSIINDI